AKIGINAASTNAGGAADDPWTRWKYKPFAAAAPNPPPSCCIVASRPEPAPASAGRRPESATFSNNGRNQPCPQPTSSNGPIKDVGPEERPPPAQAASPTAVSTPPQIMTRYSGHTSKMRSDNEEAQRNASVIGSPNRPVTHADCPSPA